MKSYAIGHFIDVDGISSHVVLGRANSRRGIETVHIDITYKDPVAALRQATPERGETVRFFDFGYNDSLEDPEVLAEFGRIASRGDLEIYDNHTSWPQESRVYRFARRIVLPREGDDLGTRCTAQILHWFFGRGDNVSELLSCIANTSDFKNKSPYTQLKEYVERLEQALKGANLGVSNLNAMDMIRYFVTLKIPERFSESPASKGLEYLFEGREAEPTPIPLSSNWLLKSRDFWPAIFMASEQSCKLAIKGAEDELMRNSFLRTARTPSGTIHMVIGFAHQALYMKEGIKVLQTAHPGFPIYACIYEDRSIIFSRDTEQVDLSHLVKAFNGGGRPAGSGGLIPEEWESDSQATIIDEVAKKIERTLANVP